MFVWCPNFSMTRARLKTPPLAKPNEPLALLEKHGNIRRIAALDTPAVKAGLHLHQPLADALAVYPALITADAEPDADLEALTALAAWAQRYSPSTAADPPSGLWLDITGCGHLWGNDEGLARDLLGRLRRKGIPAKAAIAPTFGAAHALAHHADDIVVVSGEALQSLLAPLPVERLRIGNQTTSMLRKLGLFTIGSVQKLPRAALSHRFPDLLPQLDKAFGTVDEVIDVLRQPTPWTERMRFPEPISAPEDLERVTARLLDMLCARLQEKRQGGLHFEVSFFRADGGMQALSVSTALPSRDSQRIFRLFREKLGYVDPGFGIDLAALSASLVEPLEAQQIDLVQSQQSPTDVGGLAALLDALENRLGKGSVYRLEHRESYSPERAVKRSPAIPNGSPIPLNGNIDATSESNLSARLGARPIRLFARPQPIEVTAALPDAPPMLVRWRKVLHRIARADGPERIAPEWWRGKNHLPENGQVRDYYRVESAAGLRFWVFREGAYGEDRPPRWFVHGVFP